MKLEEKLFSLRKEKGLSQQEAAEKIGVSRQAISRWEVGTAVPSYENLKCICKLYGVSADFLIDDDREGIAATQAADVTPYLQEEECILSEQTPPQKENAKSKRSKQVITAACFVVGVIAVALCAIAMLSGNIGNKGEAPIPMGEIEGREIVTIEDFELDW